MRRTPFIIVSTAVALTIGLAVAPRRYAVDGISMGPGLLPGDLVATGWLPDGDRWRTPARRDRWIVVLPDGSTGLKRIAGLPGETISFETGDLAIDGTVALKSPAELATLGSLVSRERPRPAAAWSRPPGIILDSAPFAAELVNLRLLPVRDAGFAAVVRPADQRAGSCRLRGIVGPLTVTWRLGSGRVCLVAGRLDGHAVAAAWPLPATPGGFGDRVCLPAGPPGRWDFTAPWPTAPGSPAGEAPGMSLASLPEEPAAQIDEVIVWRDVRHRPAADGRDRWSLGKAAFFLLGDFPPGSRDSRQFGPLPRSALRHRIAGP